MLEFDGEDDAFALADGFEDFSGGLTFFAVVEALEAEACSSMVQLSNGSEVDDIDFGFLPGTLHYEVAADYFPSPSGSVEVGRRFIAGFVHDPDGRAEIRGDGEYLAHRDIALPARTIRYDNTVGRSLYDVCEPLHARIGEILLYARALSAPERLTIETYLRARWLP
jgi:hypothetical protein